jgi:hypothetical protein
VRVRVDFIPVGSDLINVKRQIGNATNSLVMYMRKNNG